MELRCALALEELHNLDYRDNSKGKEKSHDVLHQADFRKVKGYAQERNVDDSACQGKSRDAGNSHEVILMFELENASPLRAHIERMEYFCHIHGQESHGDAIDAVGDLPAALFHKMADEVGRKRNECNNQSLISDIQSHAACKDAGLGGSGLSSHNIVFSFLQTEAYGCETVGHQVYPEEMDGFKDGKAEDGRKEYGQNLAHVG